MAQLFILFLFSLSAYGGIDEHFKKALGKSAPPKMRNIDFVYVINLDQRPEKFAKCVEQLALYDIEPYRFSAVNGWELSLDTINAVGVTLEPWMTMDHWGTYYPDFEPHHEIAEALGRNYFCHCMSRGAIGIVLSHLSVLQDAYDSGYQTIWVMEDDIDILQDPHILSNLIDELDQIASWDVLFTDPDTKNNEGQYVPSFGFAWRPNYSPSDPGQFSQRTDVGPFRKIGSRFGAYSMIVRRSGMEKILSFFKKHKIFLPYDIDFVFPDGINLFTVKADIVSTQIGAHSDNGAPNYKK